MERELSSEGRKWQAEKQTLLKQKDVERRQAVKEIQDQCETDYREFLSEHQDTLNKALKSAKEQFYKEKVRDFGSGFSILTEIILCNLVLALSLKNINIK